MQLIRGFHNLAHRAELEKGCVLSIGNFDGVHLGHQNVLARLIDKSLALNLPSVVMIFLHKNLAIFHKINRLQD